MLSSPNETSGGNIPDTATVITNAIRAFAAASPLNRMPMDRNDLIFGRPLVQFADGDDPIFNEYKEIIDPSHMTPREALAKVFGKEPGDLPDKLTVISWVLPVSEKTRKVNREETRTPSRLWSHQRWFGEIFNDALRDYVVEFLTEKGHLATAPMKTTYFQIKANDRGHFSNWSERHIAYAAGLGTFSLSDGFITESGIAHRCGSVVTDREIPASPRTASGPYANCLYYTNEKCGVCIQRCPAGAISEAGHDKIKCGRYLRDIGYRPDAMKGGYDLEKSVAGCGLCQTKVPCEAVNPTRKLK
jgi:epoxyqueuosine reductase